MNKKHKQEAKQQHSPTPHETTDDGGKSGMSYTVKIEPNPQDEKRYAEEREFRKEQIKMAKILNWISGAGAFIAACALVGLLWYASISKATYEAAERPYVGVNGFAVNYSPDKITDPKQVGPVPTSETTRVAFRAEIKNFGPVPGTEFQPDWKAFLNGVEIISRPKIPDYPSIIFPSESVYLSGEIFGKDYSAVQAGEKTLTIQILIKYSGPSGTYKSCEKAQYVPDMSAVANLGEKCTD